MKVELAEEGETQQVAATKCSKNSDVTITTDIHGASTTCGLTCQNSN